MSRRPLNKHQDILQGIAENVFSANDGMNSSASDAGSSASDAGSSASDDGSSASDDGSSAKDNEDYINHLIDDDDINQMIDEALEQKSDDEILNNEDLDDILSFFEPPNTDQSEKRIKTQPLMNKGKEINIHKSIKDSNKQTKDEQGKRLSILEKRPEKPKQKRKTRTPKRVIEPKRVNEKPTKSQPSVYC